MLDGLTLRVVGILIGWTVVGFVAWTLFAWGLSLATPLDFFQAWIALLALDAIGRQAGSVTAKSLMAGEQSKLEGVLKRHRMMP